MKTILHFPLWMTDGLFKNLSDWTPWDSDPEIDKEALDIDFFTEYGQRESAPQLDLLCWQSVALTPVQIQRLDKILKNRFSKNWSMLWKAIGTPYSPLENYNSTEIESSGSTHNEAHNDDEETTTSEGHTLSTGENNFIKSENEQLTAAKPFGGSMEDIAKTHGDDADNFSRGNTSRGEIGSRANKDKNKKRGSVGSVDENARKLYRYGNIGVTTSQQMLESEFELRDKWDFFQIVFNDVADILTVPVWR